MAPGQMKRKRETTGHRPNNSKVQRPGHANKQKWVSEHNLAHGSLHEGQGFALKRKEKIKHEYNKLLRQQRKNKGGKSDLKQEYPDHLQHLYLAEEQRERDELKKRPRWPERTAPPGKEEEESCQNAKHSDGARITTLAQPTDCSGKTKEVSTQATLESSPHPKRKTERKTTSYSKTKEQYKKQQDEHEMRKEAHLKHTAEREEAVRIYKEKKMARYNLLKKKTKKGQPNLNAQMELLLQKIQDSKR